MRKKTPKPKPADSLLKASKKKDIELTERELGRATGGYKVIKSKSQTNRKLKLRRGEVEARRQ